MVSVLEAAVKVTVKLAVWPSLTELGALTLMVELSLSSITMLAVLLRLEICPVPEVTLSSVMMTVSLSSVMLSSLTTMVIVSDDEALSMVTEPLRLL